MRPVITLLTDFGTADGYVGEMKGVLLTLAPGAELVDIAHDIAPQDVERARLTLARFWRRFPVGTVHLVVVDPGVGSERAALAISSGGRYLVGPDNGVLSPALLLPGATVVGLPLPAGASATFHGRDVFAPAAAALARGEPIDALGTASAAPVIRRTPTPTRGPDGALHGQVILVDRFGNAITNLVCPRGGTIQVGGLELPVGHIYSEVGAHEPVAVVGSTGFVEIAVRNGDAARMFDLRRGTSVVLRPR